MDQLMLKPSFEYLKQWVKTYDGKRRYFTFRTCMVHNFWGETGHSLDILLEEFLRDVLGDDGSKNPNFVIRIYSDHGDHQNKYNFSPSGDYEKHLPIMVNILSKNILEKDPLHVEKFTTNRKRLTTPVDFFWTDMGLIGGRKDTDDNDKEYGWLVTRIREERVAKHGTSFKNIGTDLLNEKIDPGLICKDIPFHPFYAKPQYGIDHCHCKH